MYKIRVAAAVSVVGPSQKPSNPNEPSQRVVSVGPALATTPAGIRNSRLISPSISVAPTRRHHPA